MSRVLIIIAVLLCAIFNNYCLLVKADSSSNEDGEFDFGIEDYQKIDTSNVVKDIDSLSATNEGLNFLKSGEKANESEIVSNPKVYFFEFFAIAFLFVFFINYLYGRQKNTKIAESWITCALPILKQQFAVIGPADPNLTEFDPNGKSPKDFLYKEANDCFAMYASGRIYFAGMTATLNLKPRYDIFWSILNFFMAIDDTVTLEFVIEEEHIQPLVLAICQRKFRTRLQTNQPDIQNFALPVSTKQFPANFVAISESLELVNPITNGTIMEMLENHQGLINFFHFTDQNSNKIVGFQGYPRGVLRFNLKLPSQSQLEKMDSLLQSVFEFIDKFIELKLNPQYKQKALTKRKEIMEKQRKENLQKSTESQKRNSQPVQLTPQQKKKLEAKEEKKKAKSSLNQRIKVKMAK